MGKNHAQSSHKNKVCTRNMVMKVFTETRAKNNRHKKVHKTIVL